MRYNDLVDLISNYLDCPFSGGNCSEKNYDDDFIIIKSSGIDYKSDKKYYRSIVSIKDKTILNGKTPSMELNFHLLLKKYVVHYHPVYLTTELCSKTDIKLDDIKYEFIDYATPGEELANLIEKKKDAELLFLKNHGAIINSNDFERVIYIYNKIKDEFYYKKIKEYKNKFIFPDEEVFSNSLNKKEEYEFYSFLYYLFKKNNDLNYLNNDDINKLKENKQEEYRRKI